MNDHVALRGSSPSAAHTPMCAQRMRRAPFRCAQASRCNLSQTARVASSSSVFADGGAVFSHPGDFDAAVAADVIIDLGAALGVDAMAEGDVTAE